MKLYQNEKGETIYETLEFGVETLKEYKTRKWETDWSALEDFERNLINARYSDIDVTPIYNRKKVSELWNKTMRRTITLGFGRGCPRCGSTGHYSFNLMYGTTCFSCNGAKYKQPTKAKLKTKKFLNAFIAKRDELQIGLDSAENKNAFIKQFQANQYGI